MPSSADHLWQRAISALREEIPERTVDNWLVDAVPEQIDQGADARATAVLRVSSTFCREYILSNFRSEIERALGDVLDQPVELTLRVTSSSERATKDDAPGEAPDSNGP